MDASAIQSLFDTGGVVAIAGLLVWRIDRKLERLTEQLGKLLAHLDHGVAGD